MDRSIIHLNVADFAAAVERSRDPGLQGKPLIIAPMGSPRAVVYDMSDEAFQEGIRKGMPLARALRLVRGAPLLAPSPERYERAMKDLVRRANAYSPLIESGADDGHVFIDATGTSRLFGPPIDVAWRLSRQLKSDLALEPVWSVASNMLVAKVATRLAKPIGEYVVGPGEEEAFLAPLPLDLLPGIPAADLSRLKEFNFETVSQVRALDLAQLETAFTDRALPIFESVRGIDCRPVGLASARKNDLAADHGFATDTNETGPLKQGLYQACEALCRTLRQRQVLARSVALTLSFSDGLRRSGRKRLDPPTAAALPLLTQCLPLLFQAGGRRVRIRHLRLACTRTCSTRTQLDLFADTPGHERHDRLSRTTDRIRERFGDGAVTFGLLLDRTPERRAG